MDFYRELFYLRSENLTLGSNWFEDSSAFCCSFTSNNAVVDDSFGGEKGIYFPDVAGGVIASRIKYTINLADFEISFRTLIKPDGPGATDCVLFQLGDDTQNGALRLWLNPSTNTLRLSFYSSGWVDVIQTNMGLVSSFYNFQIIRAGADLFTLRINGNQFDSSAGSYDLTGTNIYLGNNQGLSKGYYGYLYLARISMDHGGIDDSVWGNINITNSSITKWWVSVYDVVTGRPYGRVIGTNNYLMQTKEQLWNLIAVLTPYFDDIITASKYYNLDDLIIAPTWTSGVNNTAVFKCTTAGTTGAIPSVWDMNSFTTGSAGFTKVDSWPIVAPINIKWPGTEPWDFNVVSGVVHDPYHKTFNMMGWDSANGNKVTWTSVDTPNVTPTTTTPALVGVLQGVAIESII